MTSFKVRICFSKMKELKYISHLDLMRFFTRALRRSGLPLKFTQGFNPHPVFSIKTALKLGLEANNLEADFELLNNLSAAFIQTNLQRQLPDQLFITQTTVNA